MKKPNHKDAIDPTASMAIETLKNAIKTLWDKTNDPKAVSALINDLTRKIQEASPFGSQPISSVLWVPVEQVEPNDYNPNSVARVEMGLLYKSIKHDGYTQPVVTIYDPERDKYVIVDGFHRYFTCKSNPDIYNRNYGCLPIVVIEKDINERMAATVRHNRARGSHSIAGMGSLVFSMLENGWTDAEICNHLGMEAEEIIKLKHITGFSKLFKDVEYSRAWESKHQIRARQEYLKKLAEDGADAHT